MNEELLDKVKRNAKYPFKKSKLAFVGEGRAGKTSTIKNMTLGDFNPNEESTRGFELDCFNVTHKWAKTLKDDVQLHLEQVMEKRDEASVRKERKKTPSKRQTQIIHGQVVKSEGVRSLEVDEEDRIRNFGEIMYTRKTEESKEPEKFSLVIWDFGGQKAFHALHHLFFSNHSIYGLVFNLELIVDEFTREAALLHIAFWKNSLDIHCPESKVFMIGTHLDKIPNDLEKAKSILPFEFSSVDNTKGATTIPLKFAIEKHILSNIETKVPLSFTLLLDRIRDREYISMKDLEKHAEKLQMDEKKLIDALKFLHERGLINYFDQTQALKKLIIVDPAWLVDKLTAFIFDREHHKGPKVSPEFSDALEKYLNSGIIGTKLMNHILFDVLNLDKEKAIFLKELLEKMLLMAPLTKDTFAVPSMIPASPLDLEEDHFLGFSCYLDFSGELLSNIERDNFIPGIPNTFFGRLVVTCLRDLDPGFTKTKPSISETCANILFKGRVIRMEIVYGKGIMLKVKANTPFELFKDLVLNVYTMAKHVNREFFNGKLSVLLIISSNQDSSKSSEYEFAKREFEQDPTGTIPNLANEEEEEIELSLFKAWF